MLFGGVRSIPYSSQNPLKAPYRFFYYSSATRSQPCACTDSTICSKNRRLDSQTNRLFDSGCSARMSIDLLQPTTHVPPSTALRISQQAPAILRSSSSFKIPYPLSLIVSTESQELWTTYENLFLVCLRTGDDKSALNCLDRLTERFGNDNERIMALRGMYHEATAENSKALEEVLEGYVQILQENPTNVPIRKRTAALLRSIGRPAQAIETLVALLDMSPTDGEAWSELAELYMSQGQYSQARFSLEEVLLLMPNAWSVCYASSFPFLFLHADTRD